MDRVERIREVLKQIEVDAAKDAHDFDGQPFNGRTVAEYMGNQGAMIAVLAKILEETIGVMQELAEKQPV